MEEMNNNEVMIEETVDVCENSDTQNYGLIGKILVGVIGLTVAGAGALAYKNRDRLEKRRIEKLKKKGYVVYKSDDMLEDEVSEKSEKK